MSSVIEATRALPQLRIFWKRIVRGTAWTSLGAAASQGASLAAGIIIARLMGKDTYGRFGLIQTTIAVWSLIAGFGLSLTATRYLSRYRLTEAVEAGSVIGATTTLSLILAGGTSLCLFLGAGALSFSLSGRGDLAGELRVAALSMFVLSLAGVQQGILTGFEAFRGAALLNVARAVLLLPLTVLGIHFAGLSGALWAITIASSAGMVLGASLIASECRAHGIQPQWGVRRGDWNMISGFALPAFLGGLLVTPVNWLVAALLVRSSGGYGQMAILTAGVYFRTAFMFFQGATGTVLLPVFSSSSGRDREVLLWSAIKTNGIVSLGGFAVAVLAPSSLMRIFGPGFAGNGAVVVVNLAAGAIMLASAPLVYWLTSVGRQWAVARSNAVWAVVYCATAWFAINQGWAALGVASASLLAYAVQTGYCLWAFRWARIQELTI